MQIIAERRNNESSDIENLEILPDSLLQLVAAKILQKRERGYVVWKHYNPEVA